MIWWRYEATFFFIDCLPCAIGGGLRINASTPSYWLMLRMLNCVLLNGRTFLRSGLGTFRRFSAGGRAGAGGEGALHMSVEDTSSS